MATMPDSSPDLVQWLNADDAATIVDSGNDGDVDRWLDKSIAVNDAIQGSAASQPQIVVAGINGRTAVGFDGTDDVLAIADDATLNTGGPYAGKTLMMAFRTSDDVTSRQVLYEQGGQTRGLSLYVDNGTLYLNGWNLAETVWGPSFATKAITANTTYVATFVFDQAAGTVEGFIDGSSIGSVSGVSFLNSHGQDIGLGAANQSVRFHDGSDSGDGFNFEGLIGEFVQYNRALSGVERSGVEAYMQDRWQGVATPGQIDLGQLNGNNGFVVQGTVSSLYGGGIGADVAGAADSNGDGLDDVLIGAPNADDGRGEAYLVYGDTNFDATMTRSDVVGGDGVVIGNSYGPGFGEAVDGGDVDGDGLADIVIMANEAVADIPPEGAHTHIVLSSSISGTTYDVKTLDGTNGIISYSVPADVFHAGDINGDGFADIATARSSPDPSTPVTNDPTGFYVSMGGMPPYQTSLYEEEYSSDTYLIGDLSQRGDVKGLTLGLAASDLGDFNGDGFSDLGIGDDIVIETSPYVYDRKGYVLFGDRKFSGDVEVEDPAAGFRIEGFSSDPSSFRSKVIGIGDVNGDGFTDAAIVGDDGRFILFGTNTSFGTAFDIADINGTNGFQLSGQGQVRGVGDVNADGLDDFISGTQLVFGRTAGFSQVFDPDALGSDGTVSIVRNGGAWTGAVSGAGDVNGDGFDDFVIGDPSADPNGLENAGEVYVVFGSDYSGAVTHQGTSGDNSLIGNGSADVMVGGRGNDTLIGNGGADALSAGAGDDLLSISDFGFQRIHGGNGIDRLRLDAPSQTLDLTATLDPEISGIEEIDLNGGNSGLTVSPLDVVNLSNTSNTLTVFGDTSNDVQLTGAWGQDGTEVIDTVAFNRFVNGAAHLRVQQGIPVTGALPVSIDLSDLDGSDGSDGFTLQGIDTLDNAGAAVAIAGDLNNDGFDDAVVGAFAADPGGVSRAGETYVIFGGPDGFPSTFGLGGLDGTNGFRLDGVAQDDFSGGPVASAGDVDGDGIDDLILGANGVAVGANENAGAAYVVFGKSTAFSNATNLGSLTGDDGFRLSGIDAGDSAGSWVDSAGDFNGDGLADMIVGAPNAGNGGEAYVVLGQTTGFSADVNLGALTGANGFRVNAEAGDSFGTSVRGVGDVNGDRIDDVFIGAPSGNGGTGTGYVMFGSVSGFGAIHNIGGADGLNGNNGFRLDGISDGDETGFSVAAAGDFNGDGLADLVLGASGADPGGASGAGAAYLVFGSSDGYGGRLDLAALDGTNGFRLDGIDASDGTGRSVSGIGDFNADGFDDVLVGGFRGDPDGVSNAGESYLIFGTDDPLAPFINLDEINGLNGLRIDGASAEDASGRAVQGGGDLNGDGFADLIIGAAEADPGSRDRAGEAHVLFGYDVASEATEIGTAVDETLNGTPFGDILIGGRGNDTLIGGFGADVLIGAEGDDVLAISDGNWGRYISGYTRRLDGGTGTDTLRLDDEAEFGIFYNLDLTSIPDTTVRNIETIDLNGGSNGLILDRLELANISDHDNFLTVLGDATNKVRADFTGLGFTESSAGGFTEYTDGIVTLKVADAVDQDDILIA